MKAVVFAVLFFVAATYGLRTEREYQNEFTNFMHNYERSYAHDEFQSRYVNFKANIDIIDANNAENNGLELGVTEFADLTRAEFKAMYLGLRTRLTSVEASAETESPSVTLPTEVDWRTKGAVTPVKNQGQCGSCWAFSSTGALEGLHFIKSGTLQSYSEQQLVDCSGSYGNMGCNGGLMDDAFKYTAAKGIELESSYKYTAQDGTCKYATDKVVFHNTGFKDVARDDPTALMTAIAQQPVSVAVEADQSAWQLYKSGVVAPSHCGTQLDHGVLAVGYGVYQGKNMYIVKNSWGASWGMSGYILLERSATKGAGTCGIQMQPSYPTA